MLRAQLQHDGGFGLGLCGQHEQRDPAYEQRAAHGVQRELPRLVAPSGGLNAIEALGRVRTYHIEAAAFRRVEQWIAERRAFWNDRFDRLEQLVTDSPKPKGKR